MSTRGQLALDLPALARDPALTHVETDCQRAAYAALLGWRDWPGRMLALVGPEGAGKSHLAALWARMADARVVRMPVAEGEGEAVADAAAPSDGPLHIEDVDRDSFSERALLALIEAVRAGRAGPVLFTARTPPREWAAHLPDLRSRLALMPVVMIGDPSDEDLGGVFAKHLGDRGAVASPALVDYVVRRIERSFAAARDVAAALDRLALERKQRITRTLARVVLGDSESFDDG